MKYSIAFPRIFNPATGKTSLYSGQKSVESCMKLLLLSSKGELLGDTSYGSSLRDLLFEPNIEILGEMIKDEIADSINRYEKRVIVYSDNIDITRDENTVYINIVFYRRDTGEIQDIQLELFREDKYEQY